MTFVDIANGLVIILMVLGHSNLPEIPQRWIFSFHMPFFFMVSGALTNWERDSFLGFIVGKTRSLLVPFAIYSLIAIVCTPLYCTDGILEHAMDVAKHGWRDFAFWFVPVLWLALIAARGVMALRRKSYILVALALIVVACKLNSNQGGGLPWKIATVPFAASFVLIGALLKDRLKQLLALPLKSIARVGAVAAALSFAAPFFVHLDMAHNILNWYIAGYACALAGSTLMLCVAIVLERKCGRRNAWLVMAGKNTFVILAFSQMIVMGLNIHVPQLGALKYLALIAALNLIIALKNLVLRLIKKAAV